MNGALGDSNINWIFLWRLSIQKHSKSSVTKKNWNKTKYLSWISIELKFVKKNCMSNSVESLEYVMCYSSSTRGPIKSANNFVWYSCQKIYSQSRRPITILGIRKNSSFLQVINKPINQDLVFDFLRK